MNYKKYKPTLHLMVGLPFSGKSTKAQDLAKKYNSILFTPDAWNIRLFGTDWVNDPKHDEHYTDIEKIMEDMAIKLLKKGVSVILDFGCWSIEERTVLKRKAENVGASFMAHFMNVLNEELFRRLEYRNANLPKGSFTIEKEYMEKWIPLFQVLNGSELAYPKVYFPPENVGESNIFMQCDKINESVFSELPKGYSIRLCREDEIEIWAKIASPEYWKYVINYYNRVYKPQAKEFFKRCTFVVDDTDKPVSTCFLWKSYNKITTIAWLELCQNMKGTDSEERCSLTY